MCQFKTLVLPYMQPWLGMALLALLLISSDMTPITAGRIAWSAPDDSRGEAKGCPTNRLIQHASLVHAAVQLRPPFPLTCRKGKDVQHKGKIH